MNGQKNTSDDRPNSKDSSSEESLWSDAGKDFPAAHTGHYWADCIDGDFPDFWIQRSAELIYLTGPQPLNAEPPIESLMRSGFITPNSLHYVRNHGAVPKLDETHEIVLETIDWEKTSDANSLPRAESKTIRAKDLHEMPSKEIAITLTCDGNRRKELNVLKHSKGFNWGPGATSTALWKGVPLAWFLRNVMGVPEEWEEKLDGGELYLWLEGADELAHGHYGTSLPLAWAMDARREHLIAYQMNGEALPPDHGAPIRAIFPGLVGGRSVKWLARLRIESFPSKSYYHTNDNKVLPTNIDAIEADAHDWWLREEYTLYEMNVNSVITWPCDGHWIDVTQLTEKQRIAGYAYSGGGRPIRRVEISLDDGQTWRQCTICYPKKEDIRSSTSGTVNGAHLEEQHFPKLDRCWTWCHWKIEIECWELLAAREVIVRAVDSSLNTQPSSLTWNLMGMMNNAMYRVKLVRREYEKTEPMEERQKPRPWVQFVHPVCAGSEWGGWMLPPADVLQDRETVQGRALPVAYVRYTPDDVDDQSAEDDEDVDPKPDRQYTLTEIRKHNKVSDCWIIIEGAVYDVTSYLRDHPGGLDPFLVFAGGDATRAFHDVHARDAWVTAAWYRVGAVTYDVPRALIPPSKGRKMRRLLRRNEWITATLVERVNLTEDTKLYKLDLRGSKQDEKERGRISLPVGQHILLRAKLGDDQYVVRPYTPTRPIGPWGDDGTLDLLIKIYRPHESCPGGHMTTFLDTLQAGGTLEVKGPCGRINYYGSGIFHIGERMIKVEAVNLVAGGTGITPIYQIIKAALNEPEGTVKLALLYAVHSEGDVLLKDELIKLAEKFPSRLKIWPTVSSTPHNGNWKFGAGHINIRMMIRHLFKANDGAISLICGPPTMVEHAIIPSLEDLGFDKENIFEF